MFIKKLYIKNFKSFYGNSHSISFNIPDNQNKGSGLNIFVGNNNSGKSSLIEAITFLRDGTKKDIATLYNQEAWNAQGEKELFVEIELSSHELKKVMDDHAPAKKTDSYKKYIYDDGSNNLTLKAKRSWTNSHPSLIKSVHFFDKDTQKYSNSAGIDGAFKSIYDLNLLEATTDSNNEIKYGASSLCGLLLKEIASNHAHSEEYKKFSQQFDSVFNNPTSELRKEISSIEENISLLLSEQFGDAEISFNFPSANIETFFKTTTMLVNDGTTVDFAEKGSGMQRAIALSLLQVYAKSISNIPNKIPKPFFLIIDEPEVYLHPNSQIKLLESLLELSKYQQIFITTHSPFMFSSDNIRNAALFLIKKENNQSHIENIKIDNKILPWEHISWGEINYRAYQLSTVEFHNELYGYLQEYSEKHSLDSFDNWLKDQQNIKKDYQWAKNSTPKDVTLMTFIRNRIHHPENTNPINKIYTPQNLDDSISKMIDIIKRLPPKPED